MRQIRKGILGIIHERGTIMKSSVCMAAYNGDKYIEAQILSILKQLDTNDELIVVDDFSNDRTRLIIQSINDSRIRLIMNSENLGVVKTFNKALEHARGDIIFLSDQDDVWEDNKISTILREFDTDKEDLIVHDAIVVDEGMNIICNSWQNRGKYQSGILRNLIKNGYTGCCMAFTKTVAEKVLPIPSFIEIHDQWIGVMAELSGLKIKFIEDRLIKYVRHGSNVSPLNRRSLWRIINGRSRLIVGIINHLFTRIIFR